MKNLSLLLVLVFVLTILASCGSSPYKKRKACKEMVAGLANVILVQLTKTKHNNKCMFWVQKKKKLSRIKSI